MDIQDSKDFFLKLYKKKKYSPFFEKDLPEVQKINECITLFFHLLFPQHGHLKNQNSTDSKNGYLRKLVDQIKCLLLNQVKKALFYEDKLSEKQSSQYAQTIVDELMEELKTIREILMTDISSAYTGDPAARSLNEIILSYPFVYSIMIHRLAHHLFLRNIPLIPRMMSENAHSVTGIDIHPGAKIGHHFFIDHGTGVVIGETCHIGNHVKIYQAVTLGALSFAKNEKGMLVKGEKRHPTIEDDVVIYAGATILGNRRIGKNSIIGGNIWLTQSIKPGSLVTISKPDLIIRNKTSFLGNSDK